MSTVQKVSRFSRTFYVKLGGMFLVVIGFMNVSFSGLQQTRSTLASLTNAAQLNVAQADYTATGVSGGYYGSDYCNGGPGSCGSCGSGAGASGGT